MKFKTFYICLFISLYSINGFSQGYIVTKNNKSYRFSNLKINDDEVKIVNSSGKNARVLLKVVSYKIEFSDKSIYDLVSLEGSRKPVFLRRLNDGQIKLYEKIEYETISSGSSTIPGHTVTLRYYFINHGDKLLELPFNERTFLPFKSKNHQRTLRLERIAILEKVFANDSIALRAIKSPGFAASVGGAKVIANNYNFRNFEQHNPTDSTSMTILRSPKDQVDKPVDIYIGDKLVLGELKVGELVKIKVPTGVDFLLCSNGKYCEVVFAPARPARYVDLKFKGDNTGYRYDFVDGEEMREVLKHVKFRE